MNNQNAFKAAGSESSDMSVPVQPSQPAQGFEATPVQPSQPEQSFEQQNAPSFGEAMQAPNTFSAAETSQPSSWDAQPNASSWDAQPSGGQRKSPYDRWDNSAADDVNNRQPDDQNRNAYTQPQQGFAQQEQQQNYGGQNFNQQGQPYQQSQPYNGQQQYGGSYMGNTDPVPPAHGMAVATLVLGITSIVCFFFGISSLLSIICGIVGIILGSKAKKEGNTETIGRVGYIMSVVGVAVGVVIFISCVACTGLIGWGLYNHY